MGLWTRFVTILAGFGAAVALSPTAFGATPVDITGDLADGRLDGTYTRVELKAYARSAMVQGYGDPILVPPAAAVPVAGVAGVARMTAANPKPAAASALGETAEEVTLPFTGVDLGLVGLGASLILLLGLGLRRGANGRL